VPADAFTGLNPGRRLDDYWRLALPSSLLAVGLDVPLILVFSPLR
jgi:hypothetical protein